MKTRIHTLGLTLIALSVAAAGQSGSSKLPCDYSGKLLRKDNGDIVRLGSDEMKSRATHKTEVSDFMKRTDIKGTTFVEVLIGPSGGVVCVKTLSGHPILQQEIERALRAWTFKPENVNGEAVAYLGFMEFYLCNISCGDQGMSMSIVK